MNNSTMAVYQFSNAELQEIKILLEHTGKVSTSMRDPDKKYIEHANNIHVACDRLVNTINQILVARAR